MSALLQPEVMYSIIDLELDAAVSHIGRWLETSWDFFVILHQTGHAVNTQQRHGWRSKTDKSLIISLCTQNEYDRSGCSFGKRVKQSV